MLPVRLPLFITRSSYKLLGVANGENLPVEGHRVLIVVFDLTRRKRQRQCMGKSMGLPVRERESRPAGYSTLDESVDNNHYQVPLSTAPTHGDKMYEVPGITQEGLMLTSTLQAGVGC